ncbi:MAG: FecR domain-containing protein [Candidatus Omnitrophica bacterium]|nr:FecR domain-containing protein [Candidatus Omnitrophota bacterium]
MFSARGKVIAFLLFLFLSCGACISFAVTGPAIIAFGGDVKLIRSQGTKESLPEKGMTLDPGDRVITGAGAFIQMNMDKKADSTARVDENSDLVIVMDKKNKFDLISGELYLSVTGASKRGGFVIKTPCAVAGARGTAWRTYTDGKRTEVSGIRDNVFVQGINSDGSVMEDKTWVSPGFERRTERGGGPGAALKMSSERFDRMKEKLKDVLETAKKDGTEKERRKTGSMGASNGGPNAIGESFDKRETMADKKDSGLRDRKSDEKRSADRRDRQSPGRNEHY